MGMNAASRIAWKKARTVFLALLLARGSMAKIVSTLSAASARADSVAAVSSMLMNRGATKSIGAACPT